MISYIDELVKNKKVCVLGFGREGKSTLKRLLESGSASLVAVSDLKDVSDLIPDGVKLIHGESYLDSLDDFDLVFKTPGIVLPKALSEYKCEFTSETECFINCFRNQVIGITGTKGKSTTSSLLYHVLKTAGKKVLFAGNIGIPVFDIWDQVEEDSIIVIELSCHQLEYAKTSPHTALLLNIYEDHLDHYGTREKYGLAKKNIYVHQEKKDLLFTTKETLDEWKDAKGEVEYIEKNMLPFKSFDELSEVSLKGEHNLLNAAFVYRVVKRFGVTDEDFVKALESFETLPHRLEYVGKFNGVDYYDDSISTTVKSTISGVKSIKNSKVLLLGGMERNIDYTELVEFLKDSELRYIVCMYESGKRLYDMYEKVKKASSPKCIWVEDLQKAVFVAKEHALSGDAVLLSPAAASYGYFKNFEERGDAFKKYVKITP